MPLKVYTIEQSQEWDSVVRSLSSYDVYWLSGYVKAFLIHGDGEPMLFHYEEEDVRGINVVMKRDIAKDKRFEGKIAENTWFDFVTPYGYGGWLIEGNGSTAELFRAYEIWCREHQVVSEFVRFHPVLENYERMEEAYTLVSLGDTVAMDLSSPEGIWANLTSKNRNVIRKAKKAGIAIYNGRYPEIFEIFRSIYNGTMDKDNADAYYYFGEEFYRSVLGELKNEAQIFYAELGDKVIAASIVLAADGRLNYHLSGSLREYQNLAPTNLLLYEAALWGCANGCKTFHLGGGVGSQEDSLYKFKKAFYRGEKKQFNIGRKIFEKNIYDALCGIRGIESNSEHVEKMTFFPAYRA